MFFIPRGVPCVQFLFCYCLYVPLSRREYGQEKSQLWVDSFANHSFHTLFRSSAAPDGCTKHVLLVLVIIGDGPSLGHTRSAAPQPTCAPASKSLSSMIGGGVHKSTTPSSRPCLQIADGTAPPSFRAADMWVESWGSVLHAF